MIKKRVFGYFNGWVTVDEIEQRCQGYTDILFGFWVDPATGSAGAATAAVEDNGKIIQTVKSLGKKCILAAGGSTFTPDTGDLNSAATYGKAVGEYAKNNKFDGVDLDIENITMDANAINWLIHVTNAVKAVDKTLQISHAPQAPYFTGQGKGYQEVDQKTDGAIEFYLIQYYNQGTWGYQSYSNYDSMFEKVYEKQYENPTAIPSITDSGIAAEKLIIGKPIAESDAENTGYIKPSVLCGIIEKAMKNAIPFGGVMGWCIDSDEDGSWGKGISKALE